MLKKLTLENFKNFKKVELVMGAFTLLVGTNASGKSNLRDAFRFLHGLSRGYGLADIIGEKWVEGGVLQWRGIRGGTREVTFQASPSFALEIEFTIQDNSQQRDANYRIQVEVGINGKPPRVISERLVVSGRGSSVFDSHPDGSSLQRDNPQEIVVRLRKEAKKGYSGPTVEFSSSQPVLSQILESRKVTLPTVKELCKQALSALSSMRFLDLNPDQMRSPSLPGQKVLGDRGENLSSVLQEICENDKSKNALLHWIQALTPMDAVNIEFPSDQTGKILLSLIEKNMRATSAYSASDGTLRFLAMIAALIGPEPARFYFFEELENGIHPTRIHLLIQLIESKAEEGAVQVVATTHSPHLLAIISQHSLEFASLVYRPENFFDARIKRILEIPYAKDAAKNTDIAKLLSSGWLEDAVAFTENEEAKL